MAELKNSQRISYKATYNQISSTATVGEDGNSPTESLSRAVEKTAFVQSLRINSQELASIEKQLSSRANIPDDVVQGLSSALSAIERLINDKTGTSTFNNAALFAKVDPSTLVVIASSLIAYRQTMSDAVNKSIANIVSAYRGSLAPDASRSSATARSAPAATLPKGATTRTSITDSGLSIVITTIPLATSKSARNKSAVQVRGQSIHVMVHESKDTRAAFAAILSMSPGDTYKPKNSDAIFWAEKYQPKLFAGLVDHLQSYLGLSANERTVVGGAKAVLDLLESSFASTFNTGKLGGVVAGFESRMYIEPIGSLHLERIEMYPACMIGSSFAQYLPQGGCMNNYEVSLKVSSGHHVALSSDPGNGRPIPKVFVICDQRDAAPVWGYILRQQGLIVILETSIEKAIDRWSTEMSDLVVLDLDVKHERMDLYQRFRAVSVAPILLFLPTYHETEILGAYAAGVDDVVIKPVSPAIFLAKILAWMRRSWTVPIDNLSLVKAGKHWLDPGRQCLIDPVGVEIRLTNLEFRLRHLLMSRPGFVISLEDIIESIWGGYGNGDQVLLKNVVYRLRKKIEEDPSHPLFLQTGQGGYSFQGKAQNNLPLRQITSANKM